MRRAILAAAALLAGTSLASAQVLDGRWSIFGDSCSNLYADDLMTLDTVAGQIGFYESGCDIRSLNAIGDYQSVWTASLACSGEGETWTEKVIFGLVQSYDEGPDQLALIYLTNGFTTIYQRCE
jgi:hypothetical protein